MPPAPSMIGNQGQHVVRLELGLDHQINMAGGEHAIGITIAAIARQPHRLLDAAKTSPIGVVHQQRTGRDQDRVLERRARAHPQIPIAGRTAIARAPAVAGEMLAGERLVHHAVDRLAAPRQRDQRAPGRHAADEGFGAVDRVEDPDIFGVGPVGAEFLADDAVLGKVRVISARMAVSAARSAAVTGSKPPDRLLFSTPSALRKNGRMVSPETAASSSTKAAKSIAVIRSASSSRSALDIDSR